MKKISVVLFGTRPLSLKFYNILKNSKNFKVIAVVSNKPKGNRWWNKDIFHSKKKKKISEVRKMNFDIGLSINWEKKIDKKLLSVPNYGFINLHNSYMNILRGRNICHHAILLKEKLKKNFFGLTFHFMNEKFDDGDIIFSKKITISKYDSCWDLYKKYELYSEKIFKTLILDKWFFLKKKKPKNIKKFYYFKKKNILKKDITNLKKNFNFYNIVRSLEFPGFEPAFVIINNKKNFLYTKKKNDRKELFNIRDKNKNYKIYFSKKI